MAENSHFLSEMSLSNREGKTERREKDREAGNEVGG